MKLLKHVIDFQRRTEVDLKCSICNSQV